MAFQPAPGIIKVVMEFAQGGQSAVNIFHVKSDTIIGTGLLEDIVNLFDQWWEDELQDIVSSEVSLVGISARDLSEEFAAFYELGTGLPDTGTVGTPVLPFNCTACVSWRTGLTGRSTRGRTYHVGLHESAAAGGFLTSPAQVSLQAAYSALIPWLPDNNPDLKLVVLSRVQNGVPLAEALAYEILTATVDQALDSQRRRLPGRGE